MEKLELKHLAPYLPYKLKYEVYFNKNDNAIKIMDGLSLMECIVFNHYRPILRPLSDLTKEIEINNKKFIPTKEIDRIFNHELTENYPEYLPCAIMFNGNIEVRYYLEFQKLFEWHFDVFGLIEKGLAIDINTI